MRHAFFEIIMWSELYSIPASVPIMQVCFVVCSFREARHALISQVSFIRALSWFLSITKQRYLT